MLKGIIFPVFNKQIRIALIQYVPEHRTSPHERISVHPYIKSPFFLSFDKGKYEFISNRPWLRSIGSGKEVRPYYQLVRGEIKNDEHLNELIRVIDEWILRNIDI